MPQVNAVCTFPYDPPNGLRATRVCGIERTSRLALATVNRARTGCQWVRATAALKRVGDKPPPNTGNLSRRKSPDNAASVDSGAAPRRHSHPSNGESLCHLRRCAAEN